MCHNQIMHEQFMRRCLELAKLGRGKTGINPMVGAVLVRDGKIIAEGFHSEFGKDHAERDLLEPTNQSARSARFGALREISTTDMLYVSLEPCCHTQKKTPPCTDLIIESGVKHVVFGMKDPNSSVSGKGIEALKKAGIEVIGPVLEDECLRLNRGFTSLQKNHRPWITLKIARTIDGRFAKPDGSPLKITNAEQDEWSHEYLRARHDAILVGVGTILTDDPRLTVRSISNFQFPISNQPYRIILDSRLQIALTATVVSDEHVARTIVVCTPDADPEKKSALESRGVRTMECPMLEGIFDRQVLWRLLTTPEGSFHGLLSILVEGGEKTWGRFRKEGMVDEEVLLVGERVRA